MVGSRLTKRIVAFVGCVAAIVAAGCSSSSSIDSNCGKVTACGGNVVGTWKIIDSCVSTAPGSSPLGDQCPSATAQVGSFSVTGTMSFQSDMTYSVQGTLAESVVFNIPTSCIGTATCDQLTQAFQMSVTTSGVTGQCSPSGSGCSCTLSMAAQSLNESGTYTTSGTAITTTPTGGTASTTDYCVEGTTLHDFSPPGAMAMGGTSGGQVTITGDIVAQKQ